MKASWNVVGVVAEKRELKSQKNTEWRGYVVKLATLGMTAEVQCEHELYKALAVGQQVNATGTFEESQGRLRLLLRELVPSKS